MQLSSGQNCGLLWRLKWERTSLQALNRIQQYFIFCFTHPCILTYILSVAVFILQWKNVVTMYINYVCLFSVFLMLWYIGPCLLLKHRPSRVNEFLEIVNNLLTSISFYMWTKQFSTCGSVLFFWNTSFCSIQLRPSYQTTEDNLYSPDPTQIIQTFRS
jgi:hypothetical protein